MFKKSWITAAAAALISAIAALPAGAQSCSPGLISTKITPLPAVKLVDILRSAASPKDEFETSAAYQARLDAAAEKLSGETFIRIVPDYKHVTYDADIQKFVISTYAIQNLGFFFPDDMQGLIKPGYEGSHSLVVEQTIKPTGTFEASNSYGAKTTVPKVDEQNYVVYDKPKKSSNEQTFVGPQKSEYGPPTLELAVPVEQARTLKDKIGFALLVKPRAPFFRSGVTVRSAKITDPSETSITTNLIVADIKCAVITDDAGMVLALWPLTY